MEKSIDEVIADRKQWYLDNEFKKTDAELPPFERMMLENKMSNDIQVIKWLYTQ